VSAVNVDFMRCHAVASVHRQMCAGGARPGTSPAFVQRERVDTWLRDRQPQGAEQVLPGAEKNDFIVEVCLVI
jgi:hypothetical protein